jgi:hypothetical protein
LRESLHLAFRSPDASKRIVDSVAYN